MTHPLHDYIAERLHDQLKSRRVVVWYDQRRDFSPFVIELVAASNASDGKLTTVSVGGLTARLATYDGSFLEVRALVEPHVRADLPDPLLIYVPGHERDHGASFLMELEEAGAAYDPQLKKLARSVLRQRYIDTQIDDLLKPQGVTYDDIARTLSSTTAAEPPSRIRTIFKETSSTDGVLAAWLASTARDDEIEKKEARSELLKVIDSRLGLTLPDEMALAKARQVAQRYVLAADFRADFRGPQPSSLDGVPAPKTKDQLTATRALAGRLREGYADAYVQIADRVEAELGLRNTKIAPELLASADTFRFAERLILAQCGDFIASRRFDDALGLIRSHEQSFWLRDVNRKAQWEARRRMAELGRLTSAVRAGSAARGNDASAMVERYTGKDGWYRVDQAQRRLEMWIPSLDEDVDERPLSIVRRDYEDLCQLMAESFTRVLALADWSIEGSLHQTNIYRDAVAQQPKPVAYFLVDAMRFEMGVELGERLTSTGEVSVRHAIASLPSITPVGMAALQPGASGSFTLTDRGGRLGGLVDGTFLPDLTSRRKFAAGRIPGLIDIALNELLDLSVRKLANRLADAKIIVVRSQEIDQVGEGGLALHARQIMDTVIDNLARAVRKLAGAGVEHSVITADHGHLFFAMDRDESMRIDSPGGDTVDLHRRCWIGRGGATPPACIRISAVALGYDSDLELVFPTGAGVFKAGGDLAFHHGGASLQELVIPLVTVRVKAHHSENGSAEVVSATDLPEVVTNRIFSVTLRLGGGNLGLFSTPTVVRPLLMSAGRQVGAVGMAVDAEVDAAAGSVKLAPNKATTVVFLLNDDTVGSVRVVVQDPSTDAELYRSSVDIPVRLGM